jgi:outer membrane receptor protein involved in Fe transport
VLASAISAILGTGAAHSAFAQAPTEEVVVTGSRIVRRDLDAPSPIMTVDTQRLEASSTLSVETVLNQMPQFTPAQSQFSAQGEIQTSPTGSLGIGTINMRGVGTNRTLVLLDGRRAQPTNASLVVDLNTIPSAAIERIETITGGASAVYGADALAGVVNFVLKDNFEGVAFDVRNSVTEAGDGQESRVSGMLGLNSGDGGANMLLGVEWYERDVAYQKNHDFYTDGWNDPTNIASTFFPSMPGYQIVQNNRPTQAALDAVLASSGIAPGTVNVNTNPTIYFNPDGTAYTRDAIRALGFDDSQLNQPNTGNGAYGLIRQGNRIEQIYQDGELQSPLTRRSAFGKAHVDVTDHLTAFAQANYVRSEVSTFSAGPPPAVGAAWGGAIPNNPAAPNTQIPALLQTLLDSRQFDADGTGPGLPGAAGSGATQTWQLNRGLDFLGQFGPTNSSDVYQIMAGFEGDFANRDWTWEAYYSSGKTDTTNIYYGLPSIQRWQTLVAQPNFGQNATVVSSVGGNYQMTCTSGLPIFFGSTATMSENCFNAIIGGYKSQTEVSQDILEANLQGTITEMKAGSLQFAAGISNRRNGFVYEPGNPQAAIFDDPLGLFVSNPTHGDTEVSELYGELIVPIVQKLDVELGYRWSDYDSAADKVSTYKVLFNYSPTDAIRVRGGYNKASRAPNSAELFQAETAVFQTTFSSGDPCGVNSAIPGWGNRDDNVTNRAQIQTLCRDLIGNDLSTFGAPGSADANNYLRGNQVFTGINANQVGNPNLNAEEAETWTLGVVFNRPGGLDGLTASLDFYDISIADAIATFDGQTIYNKCFNRDFVSNPTYSASDPFCQLINRNPSTGGAGTVDSAYLNAGIIETSGVDIQVNWVKDLTSGGSFYMNHLVTVLNEFNTQTTPTDPVLEYKGTLGNGGQFDYRLNSTFGYNFAGSKAGVGLRWRYLPEVKNGAYVTNKATLNLPTDSYSMFDLFAAYAFNERFQLLGGIDNVFDVKPAIVGATPTVCNSASTQAGYYDILGPRLYAGIKIQF